MTRDAQPDQCGSSDRRELRPDQPRRECRRFDRRGGVLRHRADGDFAGVRPRYGHGSERQRSGRERDPREPSGRRLVPAVGGCQDAAGLWSTPVSQSFVVDTKMPTASVTANSALTTRLPSRLRSRSASPSLRRHWPTPRASSRSPTARSRRSAAAARVTRSASRRLRRSPTGEAVTLQVPAGGVQNASFPGEFNTASNIASSTYDNVAPTLTGAPVYSGSPRAGRRTRRIPS